MISKLIIDKTNTTPEVVLDPEKKIYRISGESRPSDVREFYDQIISWLIDFRWEFTNAKDYKEPLNFSFHLAYFNSSSAKLILDICKILSSLKLNGFNVTISWCYDPDDTDMLEVGKEISNIVKVPFEYIESGNS
ncbi:MAG: DUF1987 domain-containing protein [Bacteroidales bacterium]|nr:DUF1987 domain-containing protein [Bacteroidales bacterium]MBK7627047.1 DUF1987 domain-containing protein [Bacteroidales bacterium]